MSRSKKFIIIWIAFLLVLPILTVGYFSYAYPLPKANKPIIQHIPQKQDVYLYEVYAMNKLVQKFKDKSEALNFAKRQKYVHVMSKNNKTWVWNNYKVYILMKEGNIVNHYNEFQHAYNIAREEGDKILYKDNMTLIWEPGQMKKSVNLILPVISQLPELPRGCEVTSLAMLLKSANVNTDKLTLAKEVKKAKEDYKRMDGKLHYGDPNEGFVGDMYNLKEKGYGVYHKPIAELANNYLPDKVLDITGTSADMLYYQLNKSIPVWVITNTTYNVLGARYFTTWETPNGPVQVTDKEHSVLVTGYNEKWIYFNDPLTKKQNTKAPKENFIRAWQQMGSQAVTYFK